MHLFRRHFNWDQTTIRPAQHTDTGDLRTLVYAAERRLISTTSEETIRLLTRDPAFVLEADGRLQAAVGLGWFAAPVAWLRSVILDSRLPVDETLERLLPPLYEQVRPLGIDLVAVTADDWSLPWLRGPLERLNYSLMVDVIGYQKTRMDVPSQGNPQVMLRPAMPADLAEVLRLDAACFETPWVKGAEIIAPAIEQSPCFWLADLDGQTVGYAFATVHQAGRLVHLVRIAVDPTRQGQGIGVRLLNEVVRFCQRRRTTLLSLNTQANNYHAQRLYEWFGFVRSDERQRVFGYRLPPSDH